MRADDDRERPGREAFEDVASCGGADASGEELDRWSVAPEQLTELADHHAWVVRAAVAAHPRVPIATLEMLREDDHRVSLGDHLKAETTRLGLYQGQKLLVLDLERCTRCDECTRGCADSHGDGYSRLLREGLRFDRFLVAASCRSCHKPYCLEGCPVDAIHRKGKHLEVVIDNHCIGCGLCEKGCPYGAIQMTQGGPAVPRKAINCDLCGDLVPRGSDPFCVRACPHEAAFRFDVKDLLAAVGRKS